VRDELLTRRLGSVSGKGWSGVTTCWRQEEGCGKKREDVTGLKRVWQY